VDALDSVQPALLSLRASQGPLVRYLSIGAPFTYLFIGRRARERELTVHSGDAKGKLARRGSRACHARLAFVRGGLYGILYK
jgi:hypothetical protein